MARLEKCGRLRVIAVLLATAAVTVLVMAVHSSATTPPTVSESAEAAYKAAHDTDPHVPLTPYEQLMLAQKEQQVEDFFTAMTGGPVSLGTANTVDWATLTVSPASDSVAANQTAQAKSYWCGPATIREGLGQCNFSITQSQAATELHTGTDGTPWTGGPTSTGHPMCDVMNKHETRCWYVPQSVGSVPSDAQVSTYKDFLVTDIHVVSAPLIGNAWETSSSPYHLVGHPTTFEIKHWFDIRGYNDNGSTVYSWYEDSVHGASSVGWSASVPAYSSLPSHQICHIVGGYGYCW